MGSIATLVFSRKVPRVPGPLMVAAGGTLAVYLFGLGERGVGIVDGVPQGLPAFSLLPLDLGSVCALSVVALAVAFVGFIESISETKAIAAKEKYKVDSNGELRALGLTTVGASFFSRTALNHQSGARTQFSSVTTALLVVGTLVFLTPLFYYLPKAALAAIIVIAVFGLVDPKEVLTYL